MSSKWLRALTAAFALLLGVLPSRAATVAAGATLTYDAPAVARVDALGSAHALAGPARLTGAKEWSASRSVDARGKSATPVPSCVATNPAAEAAGWQGRGAYPGVDAWENVTLAKGTRVHAGEPGVSGFFASDSAAASVGHDATALNQGLQIAPRNGAFRPGLTEFELTSDVTVGRSIASANPQFGPGGLEQFYIPNWQDVTSPIVSRLMK